MKDPPLQPLRIPANWTIGDNTFAELDPTKDTMAYLCEDPTRARSINPVDASHTFYSLVLSLRGRQKSSSWTLETKRF